MLDVAIVVGAILDKLVELNNELTNELMLDVRSVDTEPGDEVMNDEVISVGKVNSLVKDEIDAVVVASRLENILVKLLSSASLAVSTVLEI